VLEERIGGRAGGKKFQRLKSKWAYYSTHENLYGGSGKEEDRFKGKTGGMVVWRLT